MDPQAILEIYQALDPEAKRLALYAIRNSAWSRPPDTVIGGRVPYMHRWFLIPRNQFGFNVYLHHFLRSDDDRALHDHPWPNISILIEGEYIEEVPKFEQDPCGERIRLHRKAGDIVIRDSGEMMHRVELFPDPHAFVVTSEGRVPRRDAVKPVWTLFITGEKVREWGFWCKNGWKHWRDFSGQVEVDGVYRQVSDTVPGCGENDG